MSAIQRQHYPLTKPLGLRDTWDPWGPSAGRCHRLSLSSLGFLVGEGTPTPRLLACLKYLFLHLSLEGPLWVTKAHSS